MLLPSKVLNKYQDNGQHNYTTQQNFQPKEDLHYVWFQESTKERKKCLRNVIFLCLVLLGKKNYLKVNKLVFYISPNSFHLF